MKSNERALLKVKGRYAYGAEGHEKYGIPPNADVEFDVHLLSYDPFKEGWMMDDEDEKLSAAKVMKLKGTKYFQEGKYKFAVRYYSRVIEFLQEEDHLRDDKAKLRTSLMLAAQLNIAACHLKLDNNLEASHACDEARKIDERCEKAFYRRATAQMNLRNFESAIEDFKALLEINPLNKLAKDQIAAASQKIREIHMQEKSIYSKMFQKKPHDGILKLWKDKPREDVEKNDDIEENSPPSVADTKTDDTHPQVRPMEDVTVDNSINDTESVCKDDASVSSKNEGTNNISLVSETLST
jgi:tetratricopeptide (TPR) repeat protein